MNGNHPTGAKLGRIFRATAGVACAITLIAVPGTAHAASTHSTDDFDFDADGLCAFTVHLTVHNEFTVTTQSTAHGSFEIAHIVETDTLTANGNTVQGLPYHWTVRSTRDANGDLLGIVAQGENWRFLLPDGGVWSAGGRSNFLTEEHVGSWIPPDDLGPVCDALA